MEFSKCALIKGINITQDINVQIILNKKLKYKQ